MSQDARAEFNHPGAYGNNFDDLAYAESVGGNFLCQETNNGIFAYYVNNASEQFFPYYVTALDQGWRTAPTANQDNHVLTDTGIRTVVVAPELSRTAIMQALEERRAYSSDDPDMRVTFLCNGSWMGSRVEVAGRQRGLRGGGGGRRTHHPAGAGDLAAARWRRAPTDDGTWGDGTAAWAPVLEVEAPSWYLLRVDRGRRATRTSGTRTVSNWRSPPRSGWNRSPSFLLRRRVHRRRLPGVPVPGQPRG